MSELKPELECYDSLVEGGVVQDALLDRLEIKGSRFTRARLMSCDASKIYVNRSEFYSCDLSNTVFSDGKLTEVVFEDCKLLGVNFSECVLDGVIFKNCIMNLSQFSNIMANGLKFEECQLEQAYFDGAKMSKSVLLNCNLSRADFSAAFIVKSDVRYSNLEGMRIAPNQLGDVIVTPDQALYLARLMGLRIEF